MRISFPVFLLAGFTLLPLRACGEPAIYQEDFDALSTGEIAGQSGWALQDGTSSLATVMEDKAQARSKPNFLKIQGAEKSMTRVYHKLPANAMDDLSNNCFQFYFSPSSPTEGVKTSANIFLIGHTGSVAVDIIEAAIDFTGSKIRLTTDDDKGKFNTIAPLSSPLDAGEWYLFKAVVEPSTKKYTLTIKDKDDNTLLSGEYAFRDTVSGPPNKIYRFDFQNNSNGHLDWLFDDISIHSSQKE